MITLAKNAAIYRNLSKGTPFKTVYQNIGPQKTARLTLDARRLCMGTCRISVAGSRTHPISTSFLSIFTFLAAISVCIPHLERRRHGLLDGSWRYLPHIRETLQNLPFHM